MYSDVFCRVYNVFGWNYYPEIFGQQLLQWLAYKGLRPKTAMDLACGTGILCRILRQEGIAADGMDFSAGMIEIAKKGNPAICYEVADMTTYRPEKQFDLVTCTGDALNHIGHLSDIEKIFDNVYAYTSAGGYFVFDILDEVIEVFKPKRIHIGHDELYTACVCERCKDKKPSDIYAEDVRKISNYLAGKGVGTMMWGEKLLRARWTTLLNYL